MSLNFVANPYSYYNNRNKTGPLFNGFIYVGIPDLDPTILANQKQVTAKQEDGTQVPIAQPIRTNSGGYAVDSAGNPVVLLVDGNYSIRVNDKNKNLALEQSNVNEGVPITIEDQPVLSVDNIEDLRLFEPDFDGQQISLLGISDQGLRGGVFYYDQSDTSSLDDSFSIVVTTLGKRWKRSNAGIIANTASELRLQEPSLGGEQINLLGNDLPGVGGGVFRYDESDTTTPDNGYSVFVTPSGKRWKRGNSIQSSISSQDFGTFTDLGIVANIALSENNFEIPKGASSLETPISLEGKKTISGVANNGSGSVVVLSGDNKFLQTISTPTTRHSISKIQVNGDNQTSSATIELKQAFLYQFDEIWLKSCFRGVTIEDSDSVVFNGLRIMETSKDYAVEVDDGCTNIIFNYSNFETGNEGFVNGGKLKINSTDLRVSTVDLNSCQFERSGAEVVNGTLRMIGGKIGGFSTIEMFPGSQDCVIDSTFSLGAGAVDIGFNNTIKNAYSKNMNTPEHKWPTPIAAAAGTTATYGAAGEEWLLLASTQAKQNSAVTGDTMTFKDGAITLATSPPFNLFAQGVSIGLENRPTYSFMSAVKTSTNPITVDQTSSLSMLVGVRGAKILNANATFDAGTSTGWTTVDASFSPSGSDVIVTPSNETWGIFQTLSGLLTIGKKYIAVVKYSGVGNIVLGGAWDGSPGERKLIGETITDPYGDGDDIQMLSFEFSGQSGNLSFGSVSSSSPVTFRYMAIIEA
tara:strand:- start:1123 stop:3366 length:2244 start_codon:yes stop_codon:yes gene_type:complete